MRSNFDMFPSKTGYATDYTRGKTMNRDVYSDIKKAGIGKEHVGQTKAESSGLGKVFRGGKLITIAEHNRQMWAMKKKRK